MTSFHSVAIPVFNSIIFTFTFKSDLLIINICNMQKDSTDVSAVVLLELKEITMHRFINNKKSLFTSGKVHVYVGNCKIAKIDHSNNSTVYFINLNSFYYTLRKDIVFVELVYN